MWSGYERHWMPRAFATIVTFMICILASRVHAQDAPRRSFSLDSRYWVQAPSNVAMGRFGVEMASLATVPADWIVPGGRGREIVRGLTVLAGSFYLGEAFSLAYHEYGHGSRNAAIGFGSRYGFGTLRTPGDAQRALREGGTTDNIFVYYLRSLTAGSGGFTVRTSEDGPFTPFAQDVEIDLAWEGLRRAGGMNNEMFLTELIEDEVYLHGGHIGFFSGYVKGKLSASSLSSSASEFGDLNRVVAFYEEQGLLIDRGDIDAASWTAFFLSAVSYQITFQTLGMLIGRPFRFEGWTFRGLQPPNTSFYMNRSGLSLKVRSAVHVGPWSFPFALERIMKGESRAELTVGARKRDVVADLGVDAVFGRRLEVRVTGTYHLTEHFALEAGYALMDERNLGGARLIPSLEGGSAHHGFYVRTSAVF